jgi:hypothetical protein
MTSEWGSHPGFGLVGFLAERGQPMSWANRTGAQFIRAYLTAGQIWIASRILHRCQEILSWESLERGGLGDALARSHTVYVEVDRRYALLQSRL